MNVCIFDKTGVGAGGGMSTKYESDPKVEKAFSSPHWNSGLNLCIMSYVWAIEAL